MLTDFLVGLFMLCVRTAVGFVTSAVALTVHLLGPGVLWVMATVAALWYLGWLPVIWHTTASFFW